MTIRLHANQRYEDDQQHCCRLWNRTPEDQGKRGTGVARGQPQETQDGSSHSPISPSSQRTSHGRPFLNPIPDGTTCLRLGTRAYPPYRDRVRACAVRRTRWQDSGVAGSYTEASGWLKLESRVWEPEVGGSPGRRLRQRGVGARQPELPSTLSERFSAQGKLGKKRLEIGRSFVNITFWALTDRDTKTSSS